MRLASFTDIGTQKKVNQDSYSLLAANSVQGPVVFAIIGDGVGGLAAGETASSTAVTRFVDWFETDFPRMISSKPTLTIMQTNIRQTWSKLISELNEDIRAYGRDNGESLGTTLTAILLYNGEYQLIHVGDCRAYRSNGLEVEQLTHDQTYVAREIARGVLTPEEAKVHPHRNALLQALGAQEDIVPEFAQGAWSSQDALLLCCDGLYKKMTENDFRLFFSEAASSEKADLQNRCERLAELALEKGETDNVTLLYAALDAVSDWNSAFASEEVVFQGQSGEDSFTRQLQSDDATTTELGKGLK